MTLLCHSPLIDDYLIIPDGQGRVNAPPDPHTGEQNRFRTWRIFLETQRLARHQNGSQRETSGREPGRRVVVERHQKARGVRGGHLLPAPPPPPPNRSVGKGRLHFSVCVCARSDTRINCVYVQFAREPAKSKSD